MASEQKPVPENQWLVTEGGQQQGPFSLDEAKQMIADNRIGPDSLVWTPGMAEWKPWKEIPEFDTPPLDGLDVPASKPKPTATEPTKAKASKIALPTDWKEYLFFRRMITPLLIQVLFWIGIGLTALTSLFLLVSLTLQIGFWGFLIGGLLSLITFGLGTLAVRIWCELLILSFRINETLVDIRDELRKK